MKKITKQFLFCALSLSALTFVSCDDDDATGDSTLEVTQGVVATVNLVAPLAATQTVNEPVEVDDEITYSYTITLNQPQSKDVHISVMQIAGSADSEDFEFTADVVIPAYATTGTGTITVLSDVAPEGTEDFTLQIGGVNTSNATLAPTTVSFTINNAISPELDLTFNFNKAFSISGTAFTLCAITYDMDFLVLDSNFDDFGVYDAATAACPEHLVMDPTTFPDGEYHIFYDIWDTGNLNGGANTATDGINNFLHDPFVIPISVDYFRAGGIEAGTFNQESIYAPRSSSPAGYQNPNGNYVVTIVVANGVYTLKNSIPEVIASGRTTNNFQAAFDHARKNRKK